MVLTRSQQRRQQEQTNKRKHTSKSNSHSSGRTRKRRAKGSSDARKNLNELLDNIEPKDRKSLNDLNPTFVENEFGEGSVTSDDWITSDDWNNLASLKSSSPSSHKQNGKKVDVRRRPPNDFVKCKMKRTAKCVPAKSENHRGQHCAASRESVCFYRKRDDPGFENKEWEEILGPGAVDTHSPTPRYKPPSYTIDKNAENHKKRHSKNYGIPTTLKKKKNKKGSRKNIVVKPPSEEKKKKKPPSPSFNDNIFESNRSSKGSSTPSLVPVEVDFDDL